MSTKLESAKTSFDTDLKSLYEKASQNCGLQVGDTVKVIDTSHSYASGWRNSWETEMDEARGKCFVIRSVSHHAGIGLDIPSRYSFPFFVLEKVAEEKQVKLNGEYTACVSKDVVRVGCQIIPWQKVEEIIEAHKSLTTV